MERTPHLGGKIATLEIAGTQVEAGPDSFLTRDPSALDLCKRLGIDDLVEPHDFGGWVWRSGKLTKLPAGWFFGIPPTPLAAFRSGVLSLRGAMRASAEIFARRPLTGPDVSVGRFVRERFGEELLERVVDPILAGTRAGEIDKMSLAAALPQLDRMARTERSVMRALRASRRNGSAGTGEPQFLAPRAGMRTIVDALVERLTGADLITSCAATHLSHEDGWWVKTDKGVVRADGIVIAVPAEAAARLLGDPIPAAAEQLSTVTAASVAIVVLAYPRDVRLPDGGSGVLVPGSEGTAVSGCTWFSRKWPHVATEHTIVRAFVGRAGNDHTLQLDDATLSASVADDLTEMLGLPPPTAAVVARWPGGLPQYEVGHVDRLAAITSALRPLGVELIGAAYEGSGIPDCIAQAERAATRLGA